LRGSVRSFRNEMTTRIFEEGATRA
jgi:hypothetical protein